MTDCRSSFVASSFRGRHERLDPLPTPWTRSMRMAACVPSSRSWCGRHTGTGFPRLGAAFRPTWGLPAPAGDWLVTCQAASRPLSDARPSYRSAVLSIADVRRPLAERSLGVETRNSTHPLGTGWSRLQDTTAASVRLKGTVGAAVWNLALVLPTSTYRSRASRPSIYRGELGTHVDNGTVIFRSRP
jgi:hypothetical protein